jgi:xanthine dehydrogenase YagR molybdenum-binding subunit
MSVVDAARRSAQHLVERAMMTAVRLAPDGWLPGGTTDPLMDHRNGLIGAPISRVDGPLKVRGEATFAAEFPLDGMTYAALAFSTIAKGRIAVLHTDGAERAAGVVFVMTHLNAPRMLPMPVMVEPTDKAAGGDTLPVMQDDRVSWNGQPIALVLAETQEQADYAASLITAQYAPEPAVTVFAEASRDATDSGTSFGQPLKLQIGDAEAALAGAAVAIDATYRTPYQNHNAMEPHAATVAWNGDDLMIHDATQGVVHTAASLATMFGIDAARVHVTSPFVGGAFGGKMLWQHQVLAAAAAKLTNRPVRIALSRGGVYRVVGGRAMTEQRVAIGADADGRFTAIIHTGTSGATRRTKVPEAFVSPTMSNYSAKTFSLDNTLAYLDVIANTQMRAPGGAVGTFALECAVDELAVALAMDPIELRIANEPAEDPTSGKAFSSRHIVEAWREGAERFGWSKRNTTPGAVREGEWLVGIGCAASSHPYVRMPGGAARITLDNQGRATVEVAAHEMGMGTATAQTQIIAERLGLPFEDVSFLYGDSTLPGLVLGAGSQQTASIGAAVVAAHRKLVDELLSLAVHGSPLAGLKADDVGTRDGGLAKVDEPERHQSYAALLAGAEKHALTVEATAPMPFEMMHWSMHSGGAVFCEVGVNAVTSEIRVRRVLGFFDCGRIMNAKTAASQLRGGIVMGLGLALMENTQVDERNGRIMNPNLSEYHVPVHMDVPDIQVMWTDIPDPHSPVGAHGIGELGITGIGAAVANAIFNATGKRVRDLPITLDKLL